MANVKSYIKSKKRQKTEEDRLRRLLRIRRFSETASSPDTGEDRRHPPRPRPQPVGSPSNLKRRWNKSNSKKPGKGGASTGVTVSEGTELVVAGKDIIKH